MSLPRLYKQIFTSNSSWTTPHGVRFVIVTGCGGGGGGGAGATSTGPSREFVTINAGGSGGNPAHTATQIVEVAPNTVYPIIIGLGGAGGCNTALTVVSEPGNLNPFPYDYNNGGNSSPGYFGSNGTPSSFGGVTFAAGGGGQGGVLYPRPTAGMVGVVGREHYLLQSVPNVPAFPAPSGPSADRARGGGGSGGGTSNNIYSVGGTGGSGAGGFGSFAFSGGNGSFGGGGGGGGAGENIDYSNTGNGACGGNGGNGFIEVSWIQ